MQLKSRTIKLMGASIDIVLYDQENIERIFDDVVILLEMYKDRFSANDDDSELMEINHNAGIKPVVVHRDLYELIRLGKIHSLAPQSLLNIAVGPIIQAWRIGFSDARVPTNDEIQALLKITDPNCIELNDSQKSVYLTKKNMEINLGALAKGYIADLIVNYLKNVGINSGLINLGGNVVTFGPALHNNDFHWRIGIQYERKYTGIDGKTYHHIIDPKTGYPVETEIAGLTILSKLSVDGEIWTTRLYGQSIETIMNTLEEIPEIEGIVVTVEGKVYYSKGILDRIIE